MTMMKLLALSSLLLVAWTPALAAAPPATPSFGESVEVNVVNVDVYAVDKGGRRVTGLGKDDFELLEDGKKVAISNFAVVEAGPPRPAAMPSAPAPAAPGAPPQAAGAPQDDLSLVVYFDDFNIRPAHRAHALQQLREFLTREVDPGTRVMLVTDDLGLHIRVPFTRDPAVIARGLQEIEALATHGIEIDRDSQHAFKEAMEIHAISLADPLERLPCPQNVVAPARSYADLRRHEVLRSIGVLTAVVNSLSGVPGRKALLHVSDGIPINPGEEVFQFLFELCGGNGTQGIGHDTTMPKGSSHSRVLGDEPDPYTVYDAREYGPRSYQAASQAMLDAQSYSVAKQLAALAAHANAQRVTLYTLQASGLTSPSAIPASGGPEDRLFQFPSIAMSVRMNHRDSLQLLADATGGRSVPGANNLRPPPPPLRGGPRNLYFLRFPPAP